jgi:hypothetical protein
MSTNNEQQTLCINIKPWKKIQWWLCWRGQQPAGRKPVQCLNRPPANLLFSPSLFTWIIWTQFSISWLPTLLHFFKAVTCETNSLHLPRNANLHMLSTDGGAPCSGIPSTQLQILNYQGTGVQVFNTRMTFGKLKNCSPLVNRHWSIVGALPLWESIPGMHPCQNLTSITLFGMLVATPLNPEKLLLLCTGQR